MRYSKYNVVIVGSGISGLFLANKLSENKNCSDGILLITKDELFSGSSSLAQGGIVSVIPEINKSDSVESHIKDTLKAGCGLNNINVVEFVSRQSSLAIDELIRFGVKFDKNEKNILDFTLEGAHSRPRILHASGDSTGRIIEEALCEKLKSANNVELYDNTMALELLVDNSNNCKGLVVYNWKNDYYEAIYAGSIVLATGGIGQIYKNTTNPLVSCGDGISLAYKAGAKVCDMEFVQFHPTALYCKNKSTMPLVSESVRGEGAKLVDLDGEYFAKNYHHQADLAPRDVVARAIMEQMKSTNANYVNLDISQIGIEKFKNRFPTITKLLDENNIDIDSGLIPVVPAEHYFMGGIKTDINCKTTINNLFAIGECACSGLHGANRLASNSLLECVVFANSLADYISNNFNNPPKRNEEKIKNTVEKYLSQDSITNKQEDFLHILFEELKTVMTENVGISRTKKSLEAALDKINTLELRAESVVAESRIKYELKSALCVSKLIVKAALERKNSIGAHYRADFPHRALENNIKEIDKLKVGYNEVSVK